MKRNRIVGLVSLLLIIFSLTGCSGTSINNTQRIVAPKSNTIPIQGKWEIIKILNNDEDKKAISTYPWVGKNVEFSNKYVLLGDFALYEPNYKIRSLNTQEYLLFNHKTFGKDFKIWSKESDVITITDREKFLCEVLKINNSEIILGIYKYSFYLKKISNNADVMPLKKLNMNGNENLTMNLNKDDDVTHTGVFIGLREPIMGKSKDTNQNIEGYKYRTLWIAATNKILHPIIETNNIFFPRRSGFWKMGVNTNKIKTYREDYIYAYNLSLGEKNVIPNIKDNTLGQNANIYDVMDCINYVGNDYISIETNIGENNKNYHKLSNLRIVPIDSLPLLKGIKIPDLIGKEGMDSINTSIDNVLNSIGMVRKDIIDDKNIDSNFGLIRKAGHWFFEGRLNYKNSESITYQSYRLNVIPPSNVVFFDELLVTWKDVKEKIPDAIDAYTSPNKDIAIILSKNNNLLIYAIKDRLLGDFPLKKIILKKGEKVIMAEWATGSYALNWEKSFLSLRSSN